ncbi:hypothetical protein PRBEI_2001262900 [Prionailurus iriomotensis]
MLGSTQEEETECAKTPRWALSRDNTRPVCLEFSEQDSRSCLEGGEKRPHTLRGGISTEQQGFIPPVHTALQELQSHKMGLGFVVPSLVFLCGLGNADVGNRI